MSSETSIEQEVETLREDMSTRGRERAKDRQRMTEIENRLDTIEARLDELANRVPKPSKKKYENMDKYDKAAIVRTKLKEIANNTDGSAQAKYRDIVEWFDGQPSAGHAYDIMDEAAEDIEFSLGETPDGEKRLTYTA